MTPRPTIPLRCCAMLAALLLGACAPYGPPRLAPGASQAEILREMGAPTGDHPLPGGARRLEFARGPAGLHTWMIDVDGDGRLRQVDQVLTVAHFDAVVPGMAADEVLRRLGRPSVVGRIGFQDRDLWNYRYDGPFCRWFQIGLDATRHVVDAGYGPDPRCDEARRETDP